MRFKNLLVTALGVIGLSALGHAQSMLDVQFQWGGVPVPSGAAVIGSSGDQWNGIDASGGSSVSPVALTDTTGNMTSATVSYVCDGAVLSLNTGGQPLPALTNGYMYNNTGGSLVVTLNGLASLANYNLVMYLASGDAAGGDRSVSGNAMGTVFSATGDPQSTFIAGENYAEVSVQASIAGQIQFVVGQGAMNTSGEVDLNGFQLQAVPEPSHVGLVGLGIAGIFLVRRRR